MTRRHLPRRCAFSLTELLVAIGVIAVLLALLMPVLARARRAARAATCAANLNQLGQAMLLYVQQNNGRLPAAHRFVQDPAVYADSRWWSWDDAIAPLLGPVDAAMQTELNGPYTSAPSPLLRCPMDEGRAPPGYVDGQPIGGVRSYSMTSARQGNSGRWTRGMGADGVGPRFRYVILSDARDASRTLLLVENHCDDHAGGNIAGGASAYAAIEAPLYQGGRPVPGTTGGPSNWTAAPPAHDGAWNYLFCDGHVERLPPGSTVTRAPEVGEEAALAAPSGMWTRETDD